MSVKVLTKHHLEFLSLKGGCTGLSESTIVKMPHCWKSHVTAHIFSWGAPTRSLSGPVLFATFRLMSMLYNQEIMEGRHYGQKMGV